MTSLYYISSTDPKNYGTVNYNITPVVSQPCQVRVSGLQYTAHFSITTNEDYIELDDERYYFTECGMYLMMEVAYKLQTVMNNRVNVMLNDRGLLTYISNDVSQITDASHRARLLMGLYHTEFPINISGNGYTAQSIPLTSFGNILYLQTNIPSIIGVGTKNKEEYRSICYKGSDYLYPGVPVNSRTPGPIVVTKSDALSDLKFQLVDFQQVPVILHSPLNITFEVYYNIQPTPMLQQQPSL